MFDSKRVGRHRAPSLFQRWKRLWRRPIVWLTAFASTVALVVAVMTTTDIGVNILETINPPEPIKVVSVTWMTGPELGPAGYVIPAAMIAGMSENEAKAVLERPVDGLATWLDGHGAVAVGSVVWQIVLEGGLRGELLVVGLRPVLAGACAAPEPGGNLIEMVSEGPVGQPVFDTDIDATEPVFVRVDIDSTRKPAFTDTVMRLPKGEHNTLLFRANTHGPHCKFRIELTYLAEGHNQAMMLTAPGGDAFEVTGHSAYKWVYRPPLVCGKVARIPGESWKPNTTKCS
jgi:hypothetical protein